MKILEKIISNKKLLIAIAAVALAVIVIIIAVPKGGDELNNSEYSCGLGYEGLRVRKVIQALGLGDGIGMGGAFYDTFVMSAVSNFQQDNGLKVTGEVDRKTWEKLGYSKDEWDLCGNYRSPARVKGNASGEERIEAMIDRAYDYLGDPYVIGASGPPGEDYGLDCSGIVIQALYAAGVSMNDINPVTHAHPGHEYESRNLWESDHFTVVDYENRERGDLIFYCNQEGIVTHIAIYLGDETVIESWPNEVQISPVIDERHTIIKGVKRVF